MEINKYKISTDCTISVEGDDYAELQLRSKELSDILRVIFNKAVLYHDGKALMMSSNAEMELMSYLKVAESDLYNNTIRLKKESKENEQKINL